MSLYWVKLISKFSRHFLLYKYLFQDFLKQITTIVEQRAHYLHYVTKHLTHFSWPPSACLPLSQYFTQASIKIFYSSTGKDGKWYYPKRSNDHKSIKGFSKITVGRMMIYWGSINILAAMCFSGNWVSSASWTVVISVVMGEQKRYWRQHRHLGEPFLGENRLLW